MTSLLQILRFALTPPAPAPAARASKYPRLNLPA